MTHEQEILYSLPCVSGPLLAVLNEAALTLLKAHTHNDTKLHNLLAVAHVVSLLKEASILGQNLLEEVRK